MNFFPDTLNDVLKKRLRKGDFIDTIFCCPYDIHELVTEEYLFGILWELNEEHKEPLFPCTFRQGRKTAANDYIGERFFRRIWNGDCFMGKEIV